MIGHVTMSAFAPVNYRLPFNYAGRVGQMPPANSFSAFAYYSDMRICAFGSEHPGGSMFAWADGSTRMLSTETEQSVLRAFCTRAGSELEGDDAE
jgi:prepilin-type processing-associated H-X9-DG protein